MKSNWVVSLLALGLTAAAAPTMAQISQAEVTGGTIAGAVVDGVSEFKGIPFAAPPTGDLRWKAPQPVRPWSGVRQTVAFGPACIQEPGLANRMAPGVALSEDCLYLDVWTPATKSGEKLPVIAWIYGGGFTGLHEQTATNPAQYRAFYDGWAKGHASAIYWDVLRALLRQ